MRTLLCFIFVMACGCNTPDKTVTTDTKTVIHPADLSVTRTNADLATPVYMGHDVKTEVKTEKKVETKAHKNRKK